MPVRPPDFEAEVRFLGPEEGGRKGPPAQGYRPDLHFDDDETNELWMIWPRFLDPSGDELPDGALIPQCAKAQFYIVNDELRRSIHRKRIHEGLRFEICEGPRRVAFGRVTKILSLHEDAV
jgi:translation elongation factor EF-Tu-like GTPase